MNVDYFLKKIPEEERQQYYDSSFSGFYQYVMSHEPVCSIVKKLYDGETLDGIDWVRMYEGLALMTSKAVEEEEKISIIRQLNFLGAKLGMNIFPQESGFYQECVRIQDSFVVIQHEQEMLKDLLAGLRRQMDDYILEDLKYLLEMHYEHATFLDNKRAYYLAGEANLEERKKYRKALQKAYVNERAIAQNKMWWLQ